MSATKQPRNLEIVVHQRETPFVGLRAHLRARGLLIPPTLPRASWEPPAAHYPLNDPADEVITGEGAVEVEVSARRPTFSLPTSLPSSAPSSPKPSAPKPSAPKPSSPMLAAAPKALSMPAQAPITLAPPRPASSPMLPPPPRPSSPQISRPASSPMFAPPAPSSMHQLPTAGYDSSAALIGLADSDIDPPTAELKWRDAEALLKQTKHGPGAMPVDDSPRTSRAEQHTIQLDLSHIGFSLSLSFISQTADQTPLELLLALRGELGSILSHEADQPHLLSTDRNYNRHIEQVILRFFSARMPQYPVVTADLTWLGTP
jgi:hypothetical protein